MGDPLLVFDLGNVILDVDFDRFARRVVVGTERSAQEAMAAFSGGPLKEALDRGQISPAAFAAQVRAWLGPAAPSEQEVLGAWCDIFALKADAREALDRCQRDHEVWLLSDTDPAHFESVLARFPLEGFDRVLVSYLTGRLKRDPGGFEPLAEVVRSGRRVIFFDDLEVNVAAACAAGVDGVLFVDWAQAGAALDARGVVA